MLVGIISDTHGLMRPEAIAALRGSDLLIHAGDVGKPVVLEKLREIAPVRAVRGNIDTQPWAAALPETEVVCAAGRRIYVLHDRSQLGRELINDGQIPLACCVATSRQLLGVERTQLGRVPQASF